jgi:glutathione synthase/RimK-type ligase-like ATP-grasp enzyme
MKKYDFAILTEARYENPKNPDDYTQNILTEDGLLKEALEKLGFRVIRLSWDRHDFDWGDVGILVFRTTWDYFHRFDEFSQWMDQVEKHCTLINSPSLIRWNIDKHYLLDLEKKGIAIPPTRMVEPGEKIKLEELFDECGWEKAILKPAISGAARHTYKLDHSNLAEHETIFQELVTQESMMLQEFLSPVYDEGEVSLMIFGGKFSHAIRKKAKPGDFRVQDDFGGTVHHYSPSPEEIQFAEKVMSSCPESPIYGRVDILKDNQFKPVVSELELIEPELWFRFKPESAEFLAEILANRSASIIQ